MKTLRIFYPLLLIGLLTLIYAVNQFSNSPWIEYNALLKQLKSEHDLATDQALMDEFPELISIRKQIEEIDLLDQSLEAVSRNPIPPNKAKSQALLRQIRARKQLIQQVGHQIELASSETLVYSKRAAPSIPANNSPCN